MVSWIRLQVEIPVSYPVFYFYKKEDYMDVIHGEIRPIYFKYLAAAFGSALVTSIYSIVDMAMVGQYQGPDGTAALAVVAPIWNIIYSLGLLMGIGGAVIFSTIKGQGSQKDDEAGEVFTVSVIGSILLALLSWFVIVVFDQPLLTLKKKKKIYFHLV